jgi:hypothetical protein
MRRVATLGLALLVTAACLGPKPQIRSAEAAAPENGKARVTVVIVNEGSGDGQVEVKVTLREGDRVVGRGQQTTELKSKETATVVLEVDVPDGANAPKVEAEVAYPPD